MWHGWCSYVCTMHTAKDYADSASWCREQAIDELCDAGYVRSTVRAHDRQAALVSRASSGGAGASSRTSCSCPATRSRGTCSSSMSAPPRTTPGSRPARTRTRNRGQRWPGSGRWCKERGDPPRGPHQGRHIAFGLRGQRWHLSDEGLHAAPPRGPSPDRPRPARHTDPRA